MASDNKQTETEMEYRLLGGTGLKISTLSFGFWATFGVKEGVERCVSVMRICRNAGVNFFDNAEAYGTKCGDAEIIMGQSLQILKKEDAIKWRRSDIVISTKIFFGGSGQNEKGLSRKHVVEGIKACLERLQLDYVDIVFCHRPDLLAPTEEVVRAMSDIVTAGYAFYWGTSEWTAQQYTEAYWIAKNQNLIPPVAEQPEYNMLCRQRFEKEYYRLYNAPYKMGTTIWSPLKSGVLTGKYNKEIPKGSRLDQKGYEFLKDKFIKDKDNDIPIVMQLTEYAKKNFNTSVSCLAIAWCIKNRNVSTVLLGATKEEQIEENLKSLAVAKEISPKHMEEIEKILNNKPIQELDWGRFLVDRTNPL